MSPVRSFPFGKEPAAVLAETTMPLLQSPPPPNPQATVRLVDLCPPAGAQPFREPPAAPMLLTAPILPLVPPLPPRVPARPRVSFRTAAALVVVVIEVLVLLYLAATWGR
jgi:hypothetical protein